MAAEVVDPSATSATGEKSEKKQIICQSLKKKKKFAIIFPGLVKREREKEKEPCGSKREREIERQKSVHSVRDS